METRPPRPTLVRPEPTVQQWVLLTEFFLGLVAIIVGTNGGVLAALGLIVMLVTLVWLVIVRVRRGGGEGIR